MFPGDEVLLSVRVLRLGRRDGLDPEASDRGRVPQRLLCLRLRPGLRILPHRRELRRSRKPGPG
ncbi:MAG: hypothetical protein MZU97_12200 [Bacillus subtilis]|nr:hypothetical protein [Bacillus subtilis]